MGVTRKPRREYLRQVFGDNLDLIKQYENLFDDSEGLKRTVDNIIVSVGLNEDGTYEAPQGTRFLDNSISVKDALEILDLQIGSQRIITVNTSTVLVPFNQTILCDCVSAELNITLPNPADTYLNNESKTFTLTKIDSTKNKVNILPFGSEKVVGEIQQDLKLEGETLTFVSNGTDWFLGG